MAAEERERLLQAWRWHELQLRINTAAPSSRHISTAWWGNYEELPGPNLPISCGFQVRRASKCTHYRPTHADAVFRSLFILFWLAKLTQTVSIRLLC